MTDTELGEFAILNSGDQDNIIDGMFFNLIQLYKERQNRKRKRRWRTRPINMDWSKTGYHQQTFLKMKEMDEEKLFCHTRMSKEIYGELLKLTAVSLTKYKEQIHAEERLSITLLYLANGTSIADLAQSHKLGKTTARNIILETCEALWEILSPIYLSEPTEDEFKGISNDFLKMWDMPNCVGALSGKHINISYPSKQKSQILVLIAACDAKYTFTTVGVEAYQNQTKGVFYATKFGKDLAEKTLPLPPNVPLPLTSEPFPHYFVGDCAFPLKENLMKPYPDVQECANRTQNVFNYRLSRASRVIENAFGILMTRWRVLKTSLEFSPENAKKIILACLLLHNFIISNDTNQLYCPANYVDAEEEYFVVRGDWRTELETVGGPLSSATSAISSEADSANDTREYLANYFVNAGAVPFQNHVK
ncbi:putative nuclease HARBI1 [Teleopsis dalmanni]|uniref:putative nuclease HARBI1 n=1 Tax=Teleopsis dalmanni TaxID=139649 RepID=UPI0018CC8BE0|nr:putative nuclease HARBI1 [Teleopsis dalmanni]